MCLQELEKKVGCVCTWILGHLMMAYEREAKLIIAKSYHTDLLLRSTITLVQQFLQRLVMPDGGLKGEERKKKK